MKEMIILIDGKPFAKRIGRIPNKVKVNFMDEVQNCSKKISNYLEFSSRKELRKRVEVIG